VASSLYSSLPLSGENRGQPIRLLELLPGDSGKLVANLFCVASPQQQSYEALSYRWSAERTHKLVVNGHDFKIGKNIRDALLSLRLPSRSRVLWVDAICINQADMAERAAQVVAMGSIYREADHVAIFLGKRRASTDHLLFDFLERGPEHADATADNVEAVIAACGMDAVAVLASFMAFCRRDWWTRVWVMQEHFLATKEPLWYIGVRCVSGNELCRDIQALAMAALRLFSPPGGRRDELRALRIRTISPLTDMMFRVCNGAVRRKQTKSYNTPRVFFAKHGRTATNPRDHVYGVRELLEPHFRSVFVPDYTISVGTLFERLAAWLLIMDGWGDMLWHYPWRLAARDNSETELASWVPDFTKRPKLLIKEREPPRLPAEGPKTLRCAIVGRCLHVEGRHLDVVDEVFVMPCGMPWDVLQRLWRMERIFSASQRGEPPPETGWTSRTLLAWATTEPTWVPLVPRWRQIIRFRNEGFQSHSKKVEARYLEMTYSLKTRVESKDLLAAFNRELEGIDSLHRFLIGGVEADFASACAFDYHNLDSQLLAASGASNAEQGIASILEQAGPRDIVYADVIRAIEKNSATLAIFRDLVSVVRGVAQKIHDCQNPAARRRFSDGAGGKIRQARRLLEEQKANLSELERAAVPVCWFAETTREREQQIGALRNDIVATERPLELATTEEAHWTRLDHAKDCSDEERAAQFRGREFFHTRGGLLGLASPGVRGVRPGDAVVLVDGLSFPLVVRERGDAGLAVVGCANVRGVTLGHRFEEAELTAEARAVVGEKQTLVIA